MRFVPNCDYIAKSYFCREDNKDWRDHLVKFYLLEHENLSLIPRTHRKKAGIVELACNAKAGEKKQAGPLRFAGRKPSSLR